MDLLLITGSNSHYVYIIDFNRFMWIRQNIEIKKCLCRYFLLCFSSEKVLVEHIPFFKKVNG